MRLKLLREKPQKDGTLTEYQCGLMVSGSWSHRLELHKLYVTKKPGSYLLLLESTHFPEPVTMEMPKYKCHKEVWALEIEKVEIKKDGSGVITPQDKNYAPFKVSKEYMDKHKPKVGGYYVQYVDGYESFSPKGAFLSGYTKS